MPDKHALISITPARWNTYLHMINFLCTHCLITSTPHATIALALNVKLACALMSATAANIDEGEAAKTMQHCLQWPPEFQQQQGSE